MKKEFFKTMLLYFLVISSLVLAANLWTEKNLWSQDYTSFIYNAKNIFSKNNYSKYVSKNTIQSSDCYSIQWITLSCDSMKTVSYLGERSYFDAFSLLEKIRSGISKAGTVSSVANDDFKNVFKSNGIAVKFSAYIPLTDYFKSEDKFFDSLPSPSVQTIFLTIPSDNSSTEYIYFYDYNTQKNYRMPVNYSDDNVFDYLSTSVKKSDNSDSFSFELNFDKIDQGVDRIPFESLLPVALSDKNLRVIEAEKINYEETGSAYDSIFKSFNIKKNSARSYTDTDNTRSFIENHATLKIFGNGYFQYEIDESFEGISLGGSDETAGAVLFANTLYKDSINNDAYLSLKNIKKINENTNQYEFTYATNCGSLYSNKTNCVVMKVKKGKITYYKQLFLDVSDTEEYANAGSLINAYDKMYNSDLHTKKAELTVTNLYPVSVYKSNGVAEQKWYFEFSDGSGEFL